jgi:hypothetical protein
MKGRERGRERERERKGGGGRGNEEMTKGEEGQAAQEYCS